MTLKRGTLYHQIYTAKQVGLNIQNLESFLVYTAQATLSLKLIYKYILTHAGTHEELVITQCLRHLITKTARKTNVPFELLPLFWWQTTQTSLHSFSTSPTRPYNSLSFNAGGSKEDLLITPILEEYRLHLKNLIVLQIAYGFSKICQYCLCVKDRCLLPVSCWRGWQAAVYSELSMHKAYMQGAEEGKPLVQ